MKWFLKWSFIFIFIRNLLFRKSFLKSVCLKGLRQSLQLVPQMMEQRWAFCFNHSSFGILREYVYKSVLKDIQLGFGDNVLLRLISAWCIYFSFFLSANVRFFYLGEGLRTLKKFFNNFKRFSQKWLKCFCLWNGIW